MLDQNLSRRCLSYLMLTALVLIAGCNTSGRLPLKGEVSFDGTPVKWGYVQFSPMPGTSGPKMGADIKDGSYEIATARGLFSGEYRVEIQAWERTDKVSRDPVTGEKIEGGVRQLLPPKYNVKSELTVELVSGKPIHDFKLDL